MRNLIKQIEMIGMPIFWQVYFAFLLLVSFSVFIISNNFWFHLVNAFIHGFMFIGVIAGFRSHKQKSVPRLLLVIGVNFLILAMILQSLVFFGLPTNPNISFLIEELGMLFLVAFAFIHVLMFEEKFNIKGFAIDFSLLIISCIFFFLLISPSLLNAVLYELSFTQQMLVVNIVTGILLLVLAVMHYFMSRNLSLTDSVRIIMTVLVVIHFTLNLSLDMGQLEDPIFINRMSWGVYHLAGAMAILFIFIEKFKLNYSAISPSRIGNQFMWVASIIAILAIPTGLILRSLQDAPTLNLLVIGIPSVLLSIGVIWRFIVLISNSNKQRSRLKALMQTNSLTDLPNYQGYLEKFVLARLNNVLCITINIDDFRAINDLHGRNRGDEVLKSLGKRIKELPEIIIAVHTHSDMFIAIFQTPESNIERLLQQVQKQLGVWDIVNGEQIAVPLTFGASFSRTRVDPEKLAKESELALKGARQAHASFSFYTEEKGNKQLPRHELRHILQQAVDSAHLPVHFQPIYNLNDGSLKAVELLIRLDSERYGLLLPGQFLEHAKSYGMLTSLTQVCIKMVAKHYEALPDVTININLPPYMLKSLKLLDNFISHFKEEKLPPHKFCIEITEDGEISTPLLIPAIQRLKDFGFSIAMDDFGAGYSSLNRLSVLDVDTVKIDRGLLLSASSGDTAILECAITLAKKLGVTAVVEGVETKEQLSLIKYLGADSVQGFLFSRPVSVKQAADIALNSNDIEIA